MVLPFPTEIWLDIFKGLAEEGEYDTLERCRVVCREFEPMARECLKSHIVFKSIEEVERIKVDIPGANRMRRWGGPATVLIMGWPRGAIPHLATFASRLGGRWPSVDTLNIISAVWRARDLDGDAVFRDLARFSSIDRLFLDHVTFPSILILGRLLCALPRLKSVNLTNVEFNQHPFDTAAISRLRLLPDTQLEALSLNYWVINEKPNPSFVEFVDIIAAISNRISIVPLDELTHGCLWSTVRSLQLCNIIFPSGATFARLLCALPALEDLDVSGPCTFMKQGFDLRSVPQRPGLPARLAAVSLTTDGRQPDSRSVVDLVDFFIITGISSNLQSIMIGLPPSLRVAREFDDALGRLLKHSAQSLHHLSLDSSLPWWISNDTDEWVHAGHSAASCFDVSANTCLKSIDFTVQVTPENISHLCAPVVEILSQATSKHISKIQVNFKSCCQPGTTLYVDLGRLMDGLRQLDTILSKPIFDNLTDVVVHVGTLRGSDVGDEYSVHDLRLCLSTLDARGILRLSRIGIHREEGIDDWKGHAVERVDAQDAMVTNEGTSADTDVSPPTLMPSATCADAQAPSSSHPTSAGVSAEEACDDEHDATAGCGASLGDFVSDGHSASAGACLLTREKVALDALLPIAVDRSTCIQT
ncbi:hypothetical protein IEO21_03934 [Rhodonia placenta]|uniref:F-box domain-containing protein n=1 Tax=Rhodonia placenta TaxID=104341 RepID=A0A8H7P5C5_9APHY|nr:hypothetical protein IEO21_03934 [Postia placenta]